MKIRQIKPMRPFFYTGAIALVVGCAIEGGASAALFAVFAMCIMLGLGEGVVRS